MDNHTEEEESSDCLVQPIIFAHDTGNKVEQIDALLHLPTPPAAESSPAQIHTSNLSDPGRDEFILKKRCVINVVDTYPETNCGSAVVVAIHKLKTDRESHRMIKNQTARKRVEKERVAMNLRAEHAGLPEPKTMEDYQLVFRNEYQFIVMEDTGKDFRVKFKGEPQDQQLYFIQSTKTGLYNVVKNPSTLVGKKFFCRKCQEPGPSMKSHKCKPPDI